MLRRPTRPALGVTLLLARIAIVACATYRTLFASAFAPARIPLLSETTMRPPSSGGGRSTTACSGGSRKHDDGIVQAAPAGHRRPSSSSRWHATSVADSSSSSSSPSSSLSPPQKISSDDDDDDDDFEQYLAESRCQFLDWAESHAIPLNIKDDDNGEDLEAIASAIGDARVVALSEGCHNSKETMRLHNRIIRHLVEHHNFTTVVTESGLPESHKIYDYVNGAEETAAEDFSIEDMYLRGLNKMYGAWEEGRALVEWMREYNLRRNSDEQQEDTLHYYGIDIGGFYKNWKTPLKEEVIGYLQRYVFSADEAFAVMKLTKLFDPFLEDMSHDARVHYTDRMTPEERDELAQILDKTMEYLCDKESDYVDRSSRTEYEWAKQSLRSMQWAEHYYRNYMDRCNNDPNKTRKFAGLNGREIAMHQNILWVMRQRPESKIIWINHVVHTKTESQYQDDMWGFFTPAGQMMKQSLGRDLFTIGLVYGSGQYWKDWQKGAEKRTVAAVPDPREDGLERTLGPLNKAIESPQSVFISWAKAPVEAWPWMQSICSIRENDYFLKIKPSEWNACIYIDTVSPCTPASSSLE